MTLLGSTADGLPSGAANGLDTGRLSAAKQASTSVSASANPSSGSLNVACAAHRRRRQLAHELSVSAKFDHHQFRADDDGARVAAQHRLRDQLDRKGRLRLQLPLLGAEGQTIAGLKAGKNELQCGSPACGTGQRPLTGAIALAPSDHRPGSDLLWGNDLRVGRWRIDLGRGAGLGRQRERQDSARDEAPRGVATGLRRGERAHGISSCQSFLQWRMSHRLEARCDRQHEKDEWQSSRGLSVQRQI